MAEDESQTKEATKINIVITCSQEEKEPPHPDQHMSAGWKTLDKIKAKKAERLFHQYCYPKTRSWEDRDRDILKEAALKILSSEFSEFIEENGLRGHAGHKKIHHTDVGALIIDLVEYAHFNRLVNLPYASLDFIRGGITKEFDEHFRWVSEILQLAGVRKNVIQKKGQEWRKKLQVAAGKITPYWHEAISEKIWPGHRYAPKKQKPHVFAAHVFADVFLGYVPQVPTDRLVEWVNIILKSLGRPTVSKSKLHVYISISKKEQRILPGTPISITE